MLEPETFNVFNYLSVDMKLFVERDGTDRKPYDMQPIQQLLCFSIRGNEQNAVYYNANIDTGKNTFQFPVVVNCYMSLLFCFVLKLVVNKHVHLTGI